jgi:hypothetical protein
MSDHVINTNGAAIRVEETEKGEPALIFLHYWGGSSQTWRGVKPFNRMIVTMSQSGTYPPLAIWRMTGLRGGFEPGPLLTHPRHRASRGRSGLGCFSHT